jgi:hypothetical protein
VLWIPSATTTRSYSATGAVAEFDRDRLVVLGEPTHLHSPPDHSPSLQRRALESERAKRAGRVAGQIDASPVPCAPALDQFHGEAGTGERPRRKGRDASSDDEDARSHASPR